MRWRWIVLGALAVLGTFYLYARLVMRLDWWSPYTPFVGFAIAGGVAGATMARHALIVPWREPIIAAIGAIAIVVGYWALLPHEVGLFFGGVPGALLSIVLVVGGAVGGAALARRYLGTKPTLVASALLNAQLLGGIAMLLIALVTVIHEGKGAFLGLMLVGIALAGFLTQAVTPLRSAWACSGGSIVLVLILLSGGFGTGADKLIGGFLALWSIGAIGAAIAWRVLPKPAAEVDVPSARLQ